MVWEHWNPATTVSGTQNVCCYLELVKGILHRELVVEPFSELKQVLHLLPTVGGGLWGWRGREGGGEGEREGERKRRSGREGGGEREREGRGREGWGEGDKEREGEGGTYEGTDNGGREGCGSEGCAVVLNFIACDVVKLQNGPQLI